MVLLTSEISLADKVIEQETNETYVVSRRDGTSFLILLIMTRYHTVDDDNLFR